MIFNRQIIKSIFLILIAILVSGCEGLPDNIVRDIKNMPSNQEQIEKFIDEQQKQLASLADHKDAVFFQYYSQSENWSQHFTKAAEYLKQANNLYDKKIITLYDEDDPKDSTKAAQLAKQFKGYLQKAKSSASYVSERSVFLIKTRDNASDIQEKVTKRVAKISQLKDKLATKIQQAITDYPNKTDDLNAKQLRLVEIKDKADFAIALVSAEFGKRGNSPSEFVNYATLGDQAKSIDQNLKIASELYDQTQLKIAQLYQSYVKVLADQLIEYYIVIRRASWCEGEYCGNGSELSYPPIKVDATVFEYFDSWQEPTLATLRRSWGKESFKIRVQQNMWKALSVNKKYRWDRNHSEADYWVNKMYAKTFHKYVEIRNDQSKETRWVSVNENVFWQQYDNLGMAILTKPYGLYEEDAMADAQPVGMATVAKPTVKNGVASGSNQYGEWRQSNGLSFWHYYGMYRMFGSLVGSSRYGYNDWYGYNNRRRGFSYYGRDNRWGTFGRSTYANSRYQNSRFAKSNSNTVYSARTGKGATASRSVRGASASSRNRGPSSRGK